MRAPPPVEHTSALGPAWRAALSLLIGAAVAVPLAGGLPYLAALGGNRRPDALVGALGQPLVQVALAAGLAALVVGMFWRLRRAAAAGQRTLRWDGQDWVLADDARDRPEQRGDAALVLDLGPWMLVRFLPHAAPGASTWLPLTGAGDPARWAALRGALWNWRADRRGARP